MNYPRVTVLMTVYNGQDFLREAISSVLHQTFEDFEFLIIDDASTDDSLRLLGTFKDARIRLYRNAHNLGQARSLNRGLKLARAPFIARIDQDDICLGRRLEEQVNFLDRHTDMAAVGTFMVGTDEGGRRRGLLGRRIASYGALAGYLMLGICPVCHTSIMYRKEVVAKLGGYDASFAPAEDVELWTRFVTRRHGIAVIPEPLMIYRWHGEQQSLMRGDVQRTCIRKAQARMIEAFCPSEGRRGVVQILSMDHTFWSESASKDQALRVFRCLNSMLESFCAKQRLSAAETRDLHHVVGRWLGPGVRFATRLSAWPSVLWYPAVGVLSPLLIPKVRPFLSYLARPVRRLRGFLTARRAMAVYREAVR